MDRFAAMQAFTRVVEAGTFAKAADSMNLPKPTVTRLIQSLEAHLQTKLLNRTTRRVTVTADGAAYYERAVRLLGELEELESSLSRAKVNPRGRLRVEIGSSVGPLLVIPALPDFIARYPELRLDVGVSDRHVDLIAENVDCVIRHGAITDESLVARRIGEFHTITVATPDYLRRHGMPQHPRDLESPQHTVVNVFSDYGHVLPFKFRRGDETIDVVGRHVVSINDSKGNIAAGLAGLGIARLSTFVAEPFIAQGILEPVLLEWCNEAIPIHVAYPPNRHLSAKLRVFIDWVAELFARSDLIARRCSLPQPLQIQAQTLIAMQDAARAAAAGIAIERADAVAATAPAVAAAAPAVAMPREVVETSRLAAPIATAAASRRARRPRATGDAATSPAAALEAASGR